MKEKLIIKNFGPIKSVELDLGRFNVLIGENGTGKSTVAKLLEVLNRYVSDLFIGSKQGLENNEARNFLTIASFKKRLKVYSIEDYLKKNSIVRYFIDDELVFDLTDDRISPSFFESDYVTTLMMNWDFQLWSYVPADRGASSLFHASTWTDLLVANAGNIDITAYFLSFYSLQDRAKRAKEEYDFTNTIGIKYQYADGREYFFDNEGNRYRLAEGSSAVQTNVSMLAIVDWLFSERFEYKSKIIIEEVELNLFPKTQDKVMKDLVAKSNQTNSVLVTTHSPYTLTSLNNMMYAYELGQKQEAEVEKLMEKKYWLNPSEVSAYMMKEDGTCDNIVDAETGLIMAEVIDTVSDEINAIYDHLSEINFG